MKAFQAACMALVLAASVGAQDAPRPTPINAAPVGETVESLATVIEREYFDPTMARRVAETLRDHQRREEYGNAPSAEALAAALNRDLYAVTHDKHLTISVVRDASPSAAQRTTRDEAARARAAARSNFGIRRVEVLPGNIGYLDISFFFRPEEAREALTAAMQLLTHADGLIIDMRDNGGGSPGTVALLMSFLLDQPDVPLFEVVHRPPEPVDRYSTPSALPAGHNGRRPVVVLTAAHTFSGGEGLAFLLQERGRAEIVGEVTAGAANPGRPYPVNERFAVTVPNGRVRSAVRKGNWEGDGVVPDVTAPAADARNIAYARLLDKLIASEPPGAWRDTLESARRSITR